MTRKYLTIALLASTLLAGAAQAKDLRIALADDPDALDPVTNTTSTGIAVMTAMCERLLYTDQELNVLPGLAESWEWSGDGLMLTLKLAKDVQFQDGTPFDAAVVKLNLDRARAPGTQRHSDLMDVTSVEAPDPLTVVITLQEPSAQILGTLAERNGIYFSPAALEREGANIGRAPVCVGPYKFVSRVAQDHLLLEKDPSYRFADDYQFERITFRVIPADSVRLANLQAGDVDLIEKLDPALAASVETDSAIRLVQNHSLNSQALMFNFAKQGPLQDVRVRHALELALDKQAINDVVFSGRYKAANQIAAPDSRFYDEANPIVQRDPAAAKALLEEAGLPLPVRIEVMIPNRPLSVRVGEMMQAMAGEAGFDIKLNVVDFATSLQLAADGQFEAWGPIGGQFANDLDNVAMQVLHSTGGRNLGKYFNDDLDALLEATRSATDPDARVAAFKQVAAHVAEQLPVIYLYHQVPIYAQRADLTGINMTGDGFLLLRGAMIGE